MPNRQLTEDERRKANDLLAIIRARILQLSGGDSELQFAYNRKIYKELSYDERDKPKWRSKLKKAKRKAQDNRCAQCHELLPDENVYLDRFEASKRYTLENTQLLCQACDRDIQKSRGFS